MKWCCEHLSDFSVVPVTGCAHVDRCRHVETTSLTFSDLMQVLHWCRGQLKCDDTRAETRFRLSAKRASPFKSAGGRQFSRLLAAELCSSAVVMLDTPCSEVVWRVLATHSIRQFPHHFRPVLHRVPSHFNWSLPCIQLVLEGGREVVQ